MSNTDKALLQQALDALVAVSDEFVCRATHHKNTDQHGLLDACPNLRRHGQAMEALHQAIAQPVQPDAYKDGMVEVTAKDGNNYCQILALLGMEEEGDPVTEIAKLIAQPAQSVDMSRLIEVLRGGRQCDEDGSEIIMSRQACHEAADILERLSGGAGGSVGAGLDDLRKKLQRRCSDWGTYWRAPDSHGVEITLEQAVELLEDALGVEVEIKNPAAEQGDAIDAAIAAKEVTR